MNRLFPGLEEDLLNRYHCSRFDCTNDFMWSTHNGWMKPCKSEILTLSCSRKLLEFVLRKKLMEQTSNVIIQEKSTVTQLLYDSNSNTVMGVTVRRENGEEEDLSADLVVDCGGPNSKQTGFNLLKKIGIPIKEEFVDAGVGYCSALYQFESPFQFKGITKPGVVYIQASPDHGEYRGFIMGMIEDGIYHFNWYGFNKEYPPSTDLEIEEWSQGLRVPEIIEVIKKGKRITPLIPYRDVCSRRICCDQCPKWPENYVVLGDTMANFTPTYGQGMTFTTLSSVCLEEALYRFPVGLKGLSAYYNKKASAIMEICWAAASGEDLCVEGVKTNASPPPGYLFFHHYIGYINKLICDGTVPSVRITFTRVLNMLDPSYYVLAPHISLRVLRLYLKDIFLKSKFIYCYQLITFGNV